MPEDRTCKAEKVISKPLRVLKHCRNKAAM